ncbi:MAG: agarase, partial [Verrucomicrobiae bacterium]|nr:agarase [Verrucomicrobiae bacterium]
RHSPNFTFEEYQWLGLPYCHLLPFAETHQWEAETRHPNFFSAEFADWCDYVARSHCARLADDPKLIGYFYVDCPAWVHTTKFCAWKGPLFDPAKLATNAGRAELHRLATQYYRITHDAIRRYDKHHLILGDRYEAKAPLPEEVVRAALPLVDVLSFQHFGKPAQVKADLARWHELTGRPVLLADGCQQLRQPDGTSRQDGQGYADTLAALRDVAGCVGFHLCGAYLRNRCRQRGLRDEQEKPDAESLALITQANREMTAWVRSFE